MWWGSGLAHPRGRHAPPIPELRPPQTRETPPLKWLASMEPLPPGHHPRVKLIYSIVWLGMSAGWVLVLNSYRLNK